MSNAREVSLSEMRVRNGICQALIDGEWVGVSLVGKDECLTKLPSIGDVVEAGTETVKVQPSTATLILGRDGMGSEADEADFEAWVDYVTKRIDERSGLDVTIEIRGARDVQDDKISADSDEDEHSLNNAKQVLWGDFCADTSAWPFRIVVPEVSL